PMMATSSPGITETETSCSTLAPRGVVRVRLVTSTRTPDATSGRPCCGTVADDDARPAMTEPPRCGCCSTVAQMGAQRGRFAESGFLLVREVRRRRLAEAAMRSLQDPACLV